MYEPIRTKSVHSTVAGAADFPHRSREDELDIQLAAHLSALLAVTDELRAGGSAGLDEAVERLAAQVARLRGGAAPVRMAVTRPATDLTTLRRRAHTLAGRALVVAASRADTAAAILAAEQMDIHAAALAPAELASL